MKIDLAKHERMSQTGSSLIKLIQNNNIPSLDLLVRESIQNSTDAALKGKGFVSVDFNLTKFKSSEFSKHLEGIEDSLNQRIKEDISTLIEVRDSNTTGLEGPIEYSEVVNNNFGNLLKLIYEISQPQQGEGAGGSWGLGKTVYFRIGLGLVVYYTRIKENGKYKSRLAACLVENEEDKNALLRNVKNKSNIERGIAWWGEIIPGEDRSRPLTDEKEIEDILKSLNIEPFKGSETGTSVIIPYINEDSLLKQAHFHDNARPENIPNWLRRVDLYIKHAIQKWYAVRLDNRNFSPGRWLRARVNGDVIRKNEMQPLFQLVQEMFNCSDRALKKERDIEMIKLQEIEVKAEEIILNRVFNKSRQAGTIYFAEVTDSQMYVGSFGYSPSPLVQVRNISDSEEMNDPIITYVRTPGMSVNYETDGSPWTNGIPKTEKGKYIVGIFIPNSKNTMTENNETITLEEYLRRGENADHISWHDWTYNGKNHGIVRKIQNHVTNKISAQFSEAKEKHIEAVNKGLGVLLGDELLPPTNFGTRPTVPRTQVGVPSARTRKPVKKASFKMLGEPLILDSETVIDYELMLPKRKGKYRLDLCVSTETGHVYAPSWEDKGEIGIKFPFSMKRFVMFEAKRIRGKKSEDIQIDDTVRIYRSDSMTLNLMRTETHLTPYGVMISVPENKGVTVFGQLAFQHTRKDVQLEISFKEEKGD